MTGCTCEEIHAAHRAALPPGVPHEPCSVKCPACCAASWGDCPDCHHPVDGDTHARVCEEQR